MQQPPTLDVWKVFDSVDQCILKSWANMVYKALNFNGFVIIVLIWISMYSNHKSQRETITCGIPRCSISNPLLFLLYINELTNVSRYCFFVSQFSSLTIPIYMFISGRNLYILYNQLNENFWEIQGWLSCNKLLLNVLKTHYMIFAPRNWNWGHRPWVVWCYYTASICYKILGTKLTFI